MRFPKVCLLTPVVAVIVALTIPGSAGAGQVSLPSGGKGLAVKAAPGPSAKTAKKKKKKKKRRGTAPAPAPAPAPAAPYLLTYEEAHRAIESWSAALVNEFARSDSWYGTWSWKIADQTCHWNYYSNTRSLTCTVDFFDYNPDYCHFYFHSANAWSANEWTVSARPTVPGSHSITIGEQYELRFFECYT